MAQEESARQDKPGFDERYKDELSVKRYTFKKVREILFSFGGMGLGAWLGTLAQGKFWKTFWDKHDISKDNSFFEKLIASPLAWGGAILGSMIGAIIIAYEHWNKEESTRLAAREINEDVANMKIRQRTDPELLRENDRLRGMLEAEEKKQRVESVPHTDIFSEEMDPDGRVQEVSEQEQAVG